MAQSDHYRGQKTIVVGNADASHVVLLLHGYTGSPADFGILPQALAENMDAWVHVPLLPGHGTHVEELEPFIFDDFLEYVKRYARQFIGTDRTLIIGGHSYGGQLAVLLAKDAKPAALVATVLPFHLRFPLSTRIFQTVWKSRKFWTKHLSDEERAERAGNFFYNTMPSKSLALLLEGNERLKQALPHIQCPTLTLHARQDRLAYADSGAKMLAYIESVVQKSVIIENGRHSLFLSDEGPQVVSMITLNYETPLPSTFPHTKNTHSFL